MNLQKLFQMQKELDEHIDKEHPPKPGEDRLEKKILALQVELGECANKWRGFKYWSHDQKPITKAMKRPTMNYEDAEWHNPLLEEFADVVHFTLSIGLEIKFELESLATSCHYGDVVTQFNVLFGQVARFANVVQNCEIDWEGVESEYERIWGLLVGLSELLGFTWEQVEQAYFEKNQVNHERQNNSY